MPEMSDLMNLSKESGRIGILLRFHGSFDAGCNGCVSMVGMALKNVKGLDKIAQYIEGSPSMSSGMHVGTIFNFHSFMRGCNKSPKFFLYIRLRDGEVTKIADGRILVIHHSIGGTWRRVCFEPELSKLVVSSLEGGEAMFSSFIESEIPASSG